MAAIPMDLLDRIRDLERQVRALMGSANTRPKMDEIQGGKVVIGDGGSLTVRTPEGKELAYVGRVSPDRPGGQYQQGVVLRRDDGSLAFSVWTGDPEDLPVQPIRMWDRKGNIIFAEDARNFGLAKPFLPYPLPVPDDATKWESTQSTSWKTLYSSHAVIQHPRIYCKIDYAYANDGGEIRLLVDGKQVGPTGKGSLWFYESVSAAYDATVNFEVQARAANGNSTVWCIPRALYGVQS
ncbi:MULTISPECIES: hypothetical protein [Streptomyces]|uniref:Uncharacterized protein n=1 Tax=Streptomyces morookaense TaxID=1970 RepID=A0A7Y7B5W5_STRMO|nr:MULTISPECIES: hypothetical protein [Streptomyces]MCC2279684.1 hypothetical protein [Streptomyces sp. ET3-23]NVK79565.1 hypothetical protein [Streptomyces morookaense]GHF48153.1 hypothetical protein GCM10010359_58010 [Streptomyces morookaense]